MNDAQRAELDRIAAEHSGMLVPKDVVEFAKNPATALHDQFTWDDSEAAGKYRIQEANQIIRVHIKHVASIQRVARSYISVPSDRANGDGYRRIEDVLSNPMLVEQMVDEVRKKVMGLSKSYGYLKFMDPLWPRLQVEMEKFLVEMKGAASDVA